MPRFWRGLPGPRVTTKPQVIRGAASPGQQCWMGRASRSTLSAGISTSRQGPLALTLGAMFMTWRRTGNFSQASFRPRGGSGSFR